MRFTDRTSHSLTQDIFVSLAKDPSALVWVGDSQKGVLKIQSSLDITGPCESHWCSRLIYCRSFQSWLGDLPSDDEDEDGGITFIFKHIHHNIFNVKVFGPDGCKASGFPKQCVLQPSRNKKIALETLNHKPDANLIKSATQRRCVPNVSCEARKMPTEEFPYDKEFYVKVTKSDIERAYHTMVINEARKIGAKEFPCELNILSNRTKYSLVVKEYGKRGTNGRTTKRYTLSCGWREIVNSNDLKVGDECVFTSVDHAERTYTLNVKRLNDQIVQHGFNILLRKSAVKSPYPLRLKNAVGKGMPMKSFPCHINVMVNGRRRIITIKKLDYSYFFRDGWKDLVKECDLKEGDECVFTLTSCANWTYKLKIKRA